jgi:hypothetical protein
MEAKPPPDIEKWTRDDYIALWIFIVGGLVVLLLPRIQ